MKLQLFQVNHEFIHWNHEITTFPSKPSFPSLILDFSSAFEFFYDVPDGSFGLFKNVGDLHASIISSV